MVEFVSANPTGPLHLGHGRQAALGDVIARLLEWSGWEGSPRILLQRRGPPDHAPGRERAGPLPAAAGPGRTGPRRRLPRRVRDGRLRPPSWSARAAGTSTTASEAALEAMRTFAVGELREEQKRDLAAFNVEFDEYYPESGLYADGRVARRPSGRSTRPGSPTTATAPTGCSTTRFGDQKDRVMVKSDGSATYFLPDVAYHMSKWERGFHDVDQRAGIGPSRDRGPRARGTAGRWAAPPEYPGVPAAPDGDRRSGAARRCASPSGPAPTPRWPSSSPRPGPTWPATSSSCAVRRPTWSSIWTWLSTGPTRTRCTR